MKFLYISDTRKQSLEFLRELAEDLNEKGIPFKYMCSNLSIETEYFKLICQPMNGIMLGRSWHKVKYYADCTLIEDMSRSVFLKSNAKKIESREQIIALLSGEVS